MLGWLVDNTHLLTFLLGVIAIGACAYAWSTGRPRHALVGLAAIALIAILWALRLFVVSDSQQILANLEAMRRGVETENYDEVTKRLSKDFRFGPITAADLQQRIKGNTKSRKFDVVITGAEAQVNGNSGDAYFNFRVDFDGSPVMLKSAKGEFVREDGAWKLKGLEIYRIGTREPERIPGIN
jgi:hypothetical protein